MTVTRTDVMPAIEELVERPTRCEHSNHNNRGWAHHHGGPATHYVRCNHDCTDGGPHVYPACAPFAAFVESMRFEQWLCPCGYMDEGRFMIEVCGPIATHNTTR